MYLQNVDSGSVLCQHKTYTVTKTQKLCRNRYGWAHGYTTLTWHTLPPRAAHRHGNLKHAPIQGLAATRLPLQPDSLRQTAEGQYWPDAQVYRWGMVIQYSPNTLYLQERHTVNRGNFKNAPVKVWQKFDCQSSSIWLCTQKSRRLMWTWRSSSLTAKIIHKIHSYITKSRT